VLGCRSTFEAPITLDLPFLSSRSTFEVSLEFDPVGGSTFEVPHAISQVTEVPMKHGGLPKEYREVHLKHIISRGLHGSRGLQLWLG